MVNARDRQAVFEPTLVVDSLDPGQRPELARVLKGAEVVVSDIDYTLIDISGGHDAGVKAVARATSPELAERFNEIFHLIVEGHRVPEAAAWSDRGAFDEIVARMKRRQRLIVPRWGLKYWSKGTMLLMAAEDVGFKFDADGLREARDAYWRTRTEQSLPYGYVDSFCRFLSERQVALYLFTSSYHILEISSELKLTYRPEKSREYKEKAIVSHLPRMVRGIIIGDPVDKPAEEFFERVVDRVRNDLGLAEGQLTPFGRIVGVGDSLRNDLEYWGRRGCPTVLVKQG